jgi:predicted ribosomally synthesized peptide with SipW-like signal peptide
MKRIILSLTLIVFIGGAIAFGATSAFFNDTETSAANAFAAGDIDLKVDNESYYNGRFNKDTSWDEDNLDGGIYKFFDFGDLKPGDYGEDTISLHVDTNDAYLCANVTLTSNTENQCNEPEALEDQTCGTSTTDIGIGQGELAGLVNFIWWADDGDNVLEDNENVISQGALDGLAIGETYPLTLADSDENIWNEGSAGGPVDGNETYYIGKAWCFGTLGTDPLPQDGLTDGWSPADENDAGTEAAGEPEDGGLTCDGSMLGNSSQTDSLTADIIFSAIQSRHNPRFQCAEPGENIAGLTLVKNVINDDFGTALPGAWTLMADGEGLNDISGTSGSLAVTNAQVLPGTYTLSESGGPLGYTGSDWSCVVNGGAPVVGNSVTIAEGDTVVCTVTNDDNEPLACRADARFADVVVDAEQGVRKDGSPIIVGRRDPTRTLGAPETAGLPIDVVPGGSSFYALGFGVGTTSSRSLTVEFADNVIVNGTGDDVRIYEVTGGVYADELALVEASQNGTTWTTLVPNATRDEDLDLGALPWAKYIRVTDLNVVGPFPSDADGYDVDALEALNCGVIPNRPIPVGNDV